MINCIDSKLNLKNKTVNDMSFDWYGTRLALIINFRKIVILDVNKNYDKNDNILFEQTFDVGVLKIKWSHPCYGSNLAASTTSKSVIIFHKIVAGKSKKQLLLYFC